MKFGQPLARSALFWRSHSSISPQFSSSFRLFGSTSKDREKDPISFEDVSRAHYAIRDGIVRTHCDYSSALSQLCQTDIYLKKDFMQRTGSFKERGARNALMSLSAEEKQIGVVAASAGNHALALAWHGRDLGIPVTCVMPINAPFAKVDKCRKYGANVVLSGEHIGAAKEYAQSNYGDRKYINGYDDPEICAGAGTMGLEILEQVPDVDVVLVPVGGCGLIAGVSLVIKTLKPKTLVIGVEPENVASFTAALAAGHPVNGFKEPTLADGLAVPIVGSTSFAIARKYTDSVALVGEEGISLAMLMYIESEKIVVEGGGAASLAAIMPGGPLFGQFPGKKVVVSVCGGNVDSTMLGRVIERGLAADGRLIRFICTISDRPGGLARLTQRVSDLGGNIKDIYHERAWLGKAQAVDLVHAKCIVETTSREQSEALIEGLKKFYPVRIPQS
jgi:threonine dehydratase